MPHSNTELIPYSSGKQHFHTRYLYTHICVHTCRQYSICICISIYAIMRVVREVKFCIRPYCMYLSICLFDWPGVYRLSPLPGAQSQVTLYNTFSNWPPPPKSSHPGPICHSPWNIYARHAFNTFTHYIKGSVSRDLTGVQSGINREVFL
jgi:hypothetical protein